MAPNCGRVPQTQRKARQRLEEATDRMARELLGIATSAESESVRLQAIRDALDRGGVTAKAAVELSAQPLKPYEEILRDMAGIATITRAESRARRGLPVDDTPALAAEPLEVVDAELVPEPGKQEPPVSRPSHAVAEPAHPDPAETYPAIKRQRLPAT